LGNLDQITSGLNKGLQDLSKDSQFVISEGARINKIINTMRKMSISQSEKRVQSAHEILEQCTMIMSDIFFKSSIEIDHDFKASNDKIHVDKDELIQAITNLMRNSLHSMQVVQIDKWKGRLTLRTENSDQGLCLWIEDNGAGIPDELQKKLFQSQFTTKSSDEGTGLGLGISRRFVREFGGDIEFIGSEKYKKTAFMIRLPVADPLKEVA
jgi:two-component system sensor histidine kinase AtoS